MKKYYKHIMIAVAIAGLVVGILSLINSEGSNGTSINGDKNIIAENSEVNIGVINEYDRNKERKKSIQSSFKILYTQCMGYSETIKTMPIVAFSGVYLPSYTEGELSIHIVEEFGAEYLDKLNQYYMKSILPEVQAIGLGAVNLKMFESFEKSANNNIDSGSGEYLKQMQDLMTSGQITQHAYDQTMPGHTFDEEITAKVDDPEERLEKRRQILVNKWLTYCGMFQPS